MDASAKAWEGAAGKMRRVVVMASGQGSLLAAIIAGAKSFEVVGVVSDLACPAIDRATAAGIPTTVVPFDASDREQWNRDLAAAVAAFEPEVIVSAGFMRILGEPFLGALAHLPIINTHPALLPSFPGAHAVRDALAYGVAITGTTVHLIDAGVDTGPIIAQTPVPVLYDDSEATLHERIKVVERELITRVLNEGRLSAFRPRS